VPWCGPRNGAIPRIRVATRRFKPGDGHSTFPTAEAAAQAGQRAAANDTAAFELLFGPSARKILSSGDSVQDKNRRAVFAAREKKLMKVERDPEDPHRATILIGEDAFPFPVPLVGTQGLWRFDPPRGKEGVAAALYWSQRNRRHRPLYRCTAYVKAEKSSRGGSGTVGRAPLRSAFHQLSGRKDGLYWAEAKVDRASLIGSLVMEAAGEGYDVSGAKPAP